MSTIDLHYWRLSLRLAARHRAVKMLAIVAIVACLMLSLVWGFYWRPLQRASAALEQRMAQERRQVVDAMQDIEIERAYRAAAEEVARIETKLGTGGGQAALVQQLAQLAVKQQVKVLGEIYEEGKPHDGYVPLSVEINLQGRYSAVRNFLSKLAELPQWVLVQEAALARNDNGEIKAQLRLVTFRKGGI